jgi:hypothetical protein
VCCGAGLAWLPVMVPVAPAAVQQVVHALTLGSQVALPGKQGVACSQGARQITRLWRQQASEEGERGPELLSST